MTFRGLEMMTAGAALLCAVGAPAAAAAQERTFDIPAGPMRAALDRFAVQADVQMLYTAEAVAGVSSPGLRGRHTLQAGLDRLLSGSGLDWTQTRPGVVVIRRPDRAEADPVVQVEDIIVTGTLLRGPAETPSPVVVLRRDDLDRAGRATVAEALVALPQNYAGSATPSSLVAGTDPMQSNSGFATGVNLRGLGPDSTLVLVNGRRLAGTGGKGDFADATALPTAAVDRVDVLLDGASALYGADAVGGVVNILLRRDFDGHESRLRIGSSNGGAEDVIAAHTAGARWSTGSALVSIEAQHQGALESGDRSYTSTGDLRPFGGTDRRTFYSTPGTIVDFAGGQFVSRFAIRPGANGSATGPADFAPGGNLGNNREGIDLLPQQDRLSAFVAASQDVGDGLTLSGDVRLSRRDYDLSSTAPITIAQVSRANPFFVSPIGAPSHRIAYSFADELGSSRRRGVSSSLGASLGLEADLPWGWDVDVYAGYGREKSENRQTGLLQSTYLAEALGNAPDNPLTDYLPGRDGFLNLFGAGASNGAGVLDFISRGYTRFVDGSRVGSINALAQGPLGRTSAGEARVAVGAQMRWESLEGRGESFTSGLAPTFSRTPGRERRIDAVFAELRLPLTASDTPGIGRLELSLAGRVEQYDDIGSTANPKVGLVWAPLDDFLLKGSWGTSFRAPALTEIYERRFITAAPLPNGVSTSVTLLEGGGNPDLEPETAETATVTADYRPSAFPGLRLSVTGFDIRFENQIGRPALDNVFQALIDPAYRPFVTYIDRSSASDRARVDSLINSPDFLLPGILPAEAYQVIVDGRWVNTSSVRLKGFDLTARYETDFGAHRVGVEATGSYMRSFVRQVTPTSRRDDVLGLFGFPVDFKGVFAATWARDALSARLAVNHVDDYRDFGGRRIDAWTTVDAQTIWEAGRTGLAAGLSATLSVRNLFDEPPPFYDAPTGLGYDPGQADPLGRTVALQLTKRW